MGNTPERAAQYVRMSTDYQQYSTANQIDPQEPLPSYPDRRGFCFTWDTYEKIRPGFSNSNLVSR